MEQKNQTTVQYSPETVAATERFKEKYLGGYFRMSMVHNRADEYDENLSAEYLAATNLLLNDTELVEFIKNL